MWRSGETAFFFAIRMMLDQKLLNIFQGRIHAIGFASLKSLNKICLWNRTASRSQKLCDELNGLRNQFCNPNVEIKCVDSVEEGVKEADIIVTATFTSTPLISRSMLKSAVHINGSSTQQLGLRFGYRYRHSLIHLFWCCSRGRRSLSSQ